MRAKDKLTDPSSDAYVRRRTDAGVMDFASMTFRVSERTPGNVELDLLEAVADVAAQDQPVVGARGELSDGKQVLAIADVDVADGPELHAPPDPGSRVPSSGRAPTSP